jgi:hypothetical protein
MALSVDAAAQKFYEQARPHCASSWHSRWLRRCPAVAWRLCWRAHRADFELPTDSYRKRPAQIGALRDGTIDINCATSRLTSRCA